MAMASGRQRQCPSACKRGDFVGNSPTDRAKNGTKRHLLVEGRGIPVSVALSGAHRHDMKMLETVLNTPVLKRPTLRGSGPQHLCLDKGYDYLSIRQMLKRRRYLAHIPRRGQARRTATTPRHPARRWVVERTGRWHNLFRRLKTRYEVHSSNYLGFVEFACAIICYRSAHH